MIEGEPFIDFTMKELKKAVMNFRRYLKEMSNSHVTNQKWNGYTTHTGDKNENFLSVTILTNLINLVQIICNCLCSAKTERALRNMIIEDVNT